jgi:N-acetylglucosamine-6-sulfatase
MGWEEITQEDGGHRSIDKVEADSLVSRAALDFIDLRASTAEPFFAFVSFGAPHTPYPHPPRFDRMYGGVRTPRNAAFNEGDVSDKPRWVRQRARFSKREVRAIDGQYRRALRSLVRVDDFVGEATDLLETKGALQNTYILFYTDNGVHTGYHRLPYGKMTPYETDMVFPMSIRSPGIEPGSVTRKLTSNVDIAPTIADLAQADVPRFVDGRSIVPLFAGDPTSWRTTAFSEFRRLPLESGTPGSLPSWYAVRTEDHSYIEYSTGETEYYDVESVPVNAENLDATLNGDQRALLRAKIRAFKNCGAGTTECRVPEGY